MKILIWIKRLFFRFLPDEYKTGIDNLRRVLQNRYVRFRLYGGRDLPVAVNIETDWRCNRNCWYCSRLKQGVTMTEELFYDIILSLRAWGFKGRVSLHSYNEPLLDKRLCEFIKFIKNHLPNCPVVIFSNGDLLTKEMMSQLIDAGMDEILVSIHEPTADVKAQELAQMASEYPEMGLIDMRDHYRKLALWNRGKEKFKKNIGVMKKYSPCDKIFTSVVKSNGNVVLCCQDGLEENVMGNLRANSLPEIWSSPRFKNIRKQVAGGKFLLPICRKCGYQSGKERVAYYD